VVLTVVLVAVVLMVAVGLMVVLTVGLVVLLVLLLTVVLLVLLAAGGECHLELAPVLTKLFRFIARQAKYPSTWGDGRATAPHKRDSVLQPGNYRPVAVLGNPPLVFETVVDDQFETISLQR